MKLNQIFVIGNLVKDAETKTMQNGKIKQTMILAINDDYKKAGTTEWIKRPYFIDCFIIGKEYQGLTKGKRVLINGKLVTHTYEANGVKKKYTAIEIYTLDFMFQQDSGYSEHIPAKAKGEDIKDMDDVDLPF